MMTAGVAMTCIVSWGVLITEVDKTVHPVEVPNFTLTAGICRYFDTESVLKEPGCHIVYKSYEVAGVAVWAKWFLQSKIKQT